MRNLVKYIWKQCVDLEELQMRYPRIDIEGHVFNITYRHNLRAKRLSMRMSSNYESVSITVPTASSGADIDRFLVHCTQWLTKRMPKWIVRRLQGIPFKHHSVFPILGRSTPLCFDTSGDHEKITLLGDRLIVPRKLDHPRMIQAFLNDRLLEYVNQKSKVCASLLNVNIHKIIVKPLKSSYGICSSKKTISYASKLVFAPLDAIDYVCAHEVAHLKEMNHSDAFWKTVKELMPDYEIHKAWLKTHGHTLQHYGGANT